MYNNIYQMYAPLLSNVSTPIETYESILGKYFIAYADNITFGNYTNAWARIYNPIGSGVVTHVNVWTVTAISEEPFRAQFWFNPVPPRDSDVKEASSTTTNFIIKPEPRAKSKIEYASNVIGEPCGGIKAFVRRAQPETTLVESENGKIILGEGNSFFIFLSNPENPEEFAEGRVALGWWEENLCNKLR